MEGESPTLTKNPDISKYKYSGYGIGFDTHETFLFPNGGLGQNVIIFGIDMSSSVHVDNKKKDILILGEGLTQGLNGYNKWLQQNIFCLSLHYNGVDSCLLMVQKLLNLKQKTLKL